MTLPPNSAIQLSAGAYIAGRVQKMLSLAFWSANSAPWKALSSSARCRSSALLLHAWHDAGVSGEC